jgi:elongation factor Ts
MALRRSLAASLRLIGNYHHVSKIATRSLSTSTSTTSKPSLELIKELRSRTGAGIADCKRALEQHNNSIEGAMSFLQQQALAAFAKEGALATDGSIGIALHQLHRGVLVDLSSQTDFVSRNETFRKALRLVTDSVVQHADLWKSIGPEAGVCEVSSDTLASVALVASEANNNNAATANDAVFSSKSVGEIISALRFLFKEDIKIRRSIGMVVHDKRGALGSYNHGDGKFGALVGLVVDRPNALSDEQSKQLQEIGSELAIHVVARSPLSISTESTSDDEPSTESQQVVATTADGGEVDMHAVAKRSKQITSLLNQPFALDEQLKVSEWLSRQSQRIGVPIVVRAFVRLERGQVQTAATL